MKMPKCCFKYCKNMTSRTLKKDGISYFRFPRDPIRCGKWMTVVASQRGEECYKVNKSSVVCSEHFAEKDMYVTDKGIKRLHKSACPYKNVKDDANDTTETETARATAWIAKLLSKKNLSFSEESSSESDTEACPKIIVADDYSELESSDEETAALADAGDDTPELYLLKVELDKLRQKEAQKDLEIKKIKRKNERLSKQTATLKSAFVLLKKKLSVISKGKDPL